MSWPELERLYRQSEAGTIPEGYAEGKAIYCPCGRFAGMRSRLTGVVWRGKVFDAADGTLVNQWCGFRAIRAQVSYGPSWLDGAPSIVMDYSATSKVWTDVRDEVREVAPRLYLGRMYRRKAGVRSSKSSLLCRPARAERPRAWRQPRRFPDRRRNRTTSPLW